MPNTRIRDQWEPSVKSIVADNPKWGPRRILGELRNRAETQGLGSDYPSERTIQRIKDDITPEQLIEYRSFHWPESMESGALPWEASAAALELLDVRRTADPFIRYLEAHPESPFTDPGREPISMRFGDHPSVRLARWYWRVTQAAPDLPGGTQDFWLGRYDIAVILAEGEARSDVPQRLRDSVEAYLSYAPWRSPEGKAAYVDGIKQRRFLTLPEISAFGYARPVVPKGLQEETNV